MSFAHHLWLWNCRALYPTVSKSSQCELRWYFKKDQKRQKLMETHFIHSKPCIKQLKIQCSPLAVNTAMLSGRSLQTFDNLTIHWRFPQSAGHTPHEEHHPECQKSTGKSLRIVGQSISTVDSNGSQDIGYVDVYSIVQQPRTKYI